MRTLAALVVLLVLVPTIAVAEEAKAVKQARLYVKLLFDSPAPPFASTKQPLYVDIDDAMETACTGLRNKKLTTDAHSKKLKACAVASRKRFTEAADKMFLEVKPYDDFIKHWPAKDRARIKGATKGMTIVEGSFTGDGESMQLYFGLNPEFSIRAIFVETDAVE